MAERRQKFWVVTGLAIIGLVSYANSFGGPFIFDDKGSILENPNILRLRPLTEAMSAPIYTAVSGRPIVSLTLALNYAISGYSVWSYHAFNLLVHILAGLVLYGIVRRTLLSERLRERFGRHSTILAGIVAAFWVVHPIQTESVTYIIQRAESLMGLFYLLTLYLAIRAMQSPRAGLWYVLSVISCAFGMATKEVTVSAPVLVLFYDRTFIAGTFRQALRKRWALYAGLAATWGILGVLIILFPVYRHGTEFNLKTILDYAMNEPAVILHYLKLTVWPVGLCLDYGWPMEASFIRVIPSLLLVVCLLAVTIWGFVRNFSWVYPAVWFFGVIAITSSFVPVWDLIFEHRIYLSLGGPVVLVVLFSYVLLERFATCLSLTRKFGHKVGALLTMAVIIFFIVLTLHRNYDYRSSESIWRATLKVAPLNTGALSGLGVALAAQGRYDEAIDCYRQAVEIEPRCFEAYYNLGNVYDKLGRFDDAIEVFKKAIKVSPQHEMSYNNIGVTYGKLGRYKEAINAFKEAIERKPDYPEAYYNMGIIYWQQGRTNEAVEMCRNAVKIRPDYKEAHYELGLCYVALGEPDLALEEYKVLKTLDGELADNLLKQIPR